MSILTKIKKLSQIDLYLQSIICRTKYLFIFSHMRSRSSVLSHILGSNLDICGYSELQLSYTGHMSLIKMRFLLFNDLKCKLNNKYLLDKILGDYLLFSNKVFEIAKPKVIFLLREPESTIKSIINMGYITDIEWYKDPLKVMDYYCSRLLSLEEYSKKVAGNYFFIESDDLLDNTEYILDCLTKWLNLSEPLDKRYSIFHNTGKPGYGDPSDHIKSGMLEKTKGYPVIKIPLEVLKRGEYSYKKCKDSLLSGIT